MGRPLHALRAKGEPPTVRLQMSRMPHLDARKVRRHVRSLAGANGLIKSPDACELPHASPVPMRDSDCPACPNPGHTSPELYDLAAVGRAGVTERRPSFH